MRRRAAYVIFFLFILVPALTRAGDEYNYDTYQKRFTQAFYQGNDYRLYKAMEEFARRHPDSPELWLVLDDLAKLYNVAGYDQVRSLLASLASRIAGSEIASKELLLLKLHTLKDELDYYFRKETASYIVREYKPIREWQLSRVFRKYGAADMTYPFAPETDRNREGAGWRTVITKEHAATLYIDRFIAETDGVVYFKTGLAIPAGAKLRIEGACSYTLFLNRQEVLANRKDAVYRNQRIIQFDKPSTIELLFKLNLADQAGIRVILTDSHDRPLANWKTRQEPVVYALSSGVYREVLDYPYAYLTQQAATGNVNALYNLGWYFTILDSRESLAYYRQYIDQTQEVSAKAVLANTLIALSPHGENSADYQQGWAMLQRLWRTHPDCVPVQHYRFRKLLRQGKSDRALQLAARIKEQAPYYLPLREDLIKLYLGKKYTAESLASIHALVRDFPYALAAKEYLLDYFSNRNNERSLQIAQEILERTRNYTVTKKIVQLLHNMKKYREVIHYLEEYCNDGSPEALLESAALYLDLEEYTKAKNILLRLVAQKQDPLYYYYLGLIEVRQGKDAALYWGKLRSLQPLSTFPANYLTYKQEGALVSFFESYRDKDIIDNALQAFTGGQEYTDTIVYRGHFYYIDGRYGARVFREELIYIKDEDDIERWGEYRIPFRATHLQVARARVYQRDGSYSDAYHVHATDSSSYVTLSNIQKDTLVHLQYEVPHAYRNLYGSDFVQTPLTLLQNYDEPIGYAALKVHAPAAQKLQLYLNRDTTVTKKKAGRNNVYEVSWKAIPEIERETFSGERWRNLLTYEISTFPTYEDFIRWYSGNIPADTKGSLLRAAGIDVSVGQEDIIRQVYYFVARTIDRTGTTVFKPQPASEVLYARKGKVEDKVFLARALLEEAGIKSYPALVYKELPGRSDNFIATHCFSSVLLYLPLEKGRELWFDFSNKYFPQGAVQPEHERNNALIMLGTSYDVKKIHARVARHIHSEYRGNIEESGSLALRANVVFSGAGNTIKAYFTDKRYYSENITRYFDFLRHDLILEHFTLDTAQDENFLLKARGIMPGFARVGQHTLSFMPFMHEFAFVQYIRTLERRTPLVIKQTYSLENSYTYALPEAFAGVTYSYERRLRWEKGEVYLRVEKKKGERTLRAVQKMYFPATEVTPQAYQAFLKFCIEMRKENNKRVVLTTHQE